MAPADGPEADPAAPAVPAAGSPRASLTVTPCSLDDATCPAATARSLPSRLANSTLPSYTVTTRAAPIAAPTTPCHGFFIVSSSTRKQVPVTRTVPCGVSTSKPPPRSTR